jgi:hypothetical protein
VTVAAVASAGIGGEAGRWGVSAIGQWRPGRRFGLRVGGEARAGELPAAQATAYTFVVQAGGDLVLADPRVGAPWGLALHADVELVAEALSHLSADDPAAVRRTRWLPGADAAIEPSLRLSPALDLVLSGALEATAGATDVFVARRTVATIPAFRFVTRLGLRAAF